MTRNEALIYRVRYTTAEAIFRIAAWVKPSNYEFEAVQAATHTVIASLTMTEDELFRGLDDLMSPADRQVTKDTEASQS